MTAHSKCKPSQDQPGPGHNQLGFEVWVSNYVDGELRPELRDLPVDDMTKTFVDHAPDLTEEQKHQLASLLWHPR